MTVQFVPKLPVVVTAPSRCLRVSALILACLAVSCAVSIAAYPFFITADGAQRWRFAMHLFTGEPFSELCLVPPLGALLMAAVYGATGSYFLYALLQSLSMLLGGSLLIARLTPAGTRIGGLVVPVACFLLFPTVAVFSVVL